MSSHRRPDTRRLPAAFPRSRCLSCLTLTHPLIVSRLEPWLPGCRVLPGRVAGLPGCCRVSAGLPGAGCCRVLPGAAGCCRVLPGCEDVCPLSGAAGCCRVAGLPGAAGLPGCRVVLDSFEGEKSVRLVTLI